MTLRKILQVAAQALAGEPVEDPQSVLEAIDKLSQWCYRDLRTDDLERVCRCANCAHYKRYRKKGQPRSRGKMLCKFDKSPRHPDYYCASARRKP